MSEDNVGSSWEYMVVRMVAHMIDNSVTYGIIFLLLYLAGIAYIVAWLIQRSRASSDE